MLRRSFLFLVLVPILVSALSAEAKRADLAGQWYSASPKILRAELDGYLLAAGEVKVDGTVVGVITPHAGFRYSGPIAAYAYKALMADPPEKVVLVGFTHRKYFPGKIAVFTDDVFLTPLGGARIDRELTRRFLDYGGGLTSIPEAFENENSVEMEIPFIQVAFKKARLVILAMCDQKLENAQLLADSLYEVLKDETDYVMIASTDMCHYLSYGEAKRRDKQTIKLIEKFDPDGMYRESLRGGHELMCGYGVVYGVMSASKRLGADRAEILKYANSGDTSGMRDRVVGYLSAAFVRSGPPASGAPEEKSAKEEMMLNKAQREELLNIARNTIKEYLETGKRLEVGTDDEELKQDMGAFVTLHTKGQLRGCIGSMVARGPLYLTVRDMAIAAATEDPRFPSMRAEELDDVDIEISVLTPMRKIDDYNTIETGKHGVMVRQGWRSGVYLPQVADETGWDREQFMNSLCAHKAGIPADSWKTGECEIYVFTAEVFGEKEGE